jgi:hypothetical protein
VFNRVRAYIIILVLMNFALGAVCIFADDSFKAPAYDYVKEIMPLTRWGIAWWATCAGAAYGYISRQLNWARIAMSVSAAIMATWGVSFIVALITGLAQGPTGGIVWLAVAALEVVIVSTPNIRPIEEYVSRPEYRA